MAMRSRFLSLVALLIAPGFVWPQGNPVGPEFRVNTNTSGLQARPAIATDSAGNFVVVWNSGTTTDYDVFGQRYASSGVPLGPEFRVNDDTLGSHSAPAVAADSAGNFVVVWHFGGVGVVGQRYASSGALLGTQFGVSSLPGH
jgi:hypothetical protein